jgi:hypothetical protein
MIMATTQRISGWFGGKAGGIRQVLTAAWALWVTLFAATAHATPAWTLRGEAVVTLDGPGLGLDLSHPVTDWLAVDGGLGLILLQDQRGQVADGLLLARLGWFGQRNAVSLGLGPRVLYDPAGWGPVAFLHAEPSYEFRSRGGFSFLAGYGFSMALHDSATNRCPSTTFLCTDHFVTGQLGPRVRLALGHTF